MSPGLLNHYKARKDKDANKQVRNWLKKIKTFGGNSQVLVVVNKIELNRSFGLDESRLSTEFPQIKKFIKISCKQKEKINKVKNALAKYILQTELFHTEIDERWLPIKDSLQQQTSNNESHYLSESQFLKICQENYLTKESEQQSAIEFLNDLGVVLHFEKLDMAEFYVLDPYWVTSGVYRILTSDHAGINKGTIAYEQLKTIINTPNKSVNENREPVVYSSNEARYIADIMAQFKLSYYIEDHDNRKILIPSLLDTNTPKEQTEAITHAAEKISLIYDYDYLPHYLLLNLIVEMRQDITTSWRSGMVLACNTSDAKALVRSLSSNCIEVIITGEHKHKRDYLSVIRFFIENINRDYKLAPEINIPLPGYPKKYVSYQELIHMEQAGKTIYTDWKIKAEFDISQLLNGVESSIDIHRRGSSIQSGYANDGVLKTVNIFLASSEELLHERNQFEANITQLNNDTYRKRGIELKLTRWENFIDAMSVDGLQSEYNKAVEDADIFVMLFFTKVGKFTQEEFERAFGQYKKDGKPLVYVCFKDAPINTGKLNKRDTGSLLEFNEKLEELGHYHKKFTNDDGLNLYFGRQLKKILPDILADK